MLGLQSEKWEKREFIRVLHSGLGFTVGFGVGSAFGNSFAQRKA